MTSTTDLPPASPPGDHPAPKPNAFERIAGVFMSPVETFTSIAQHPDWVVPLLIIFVLSLGAGLTIALRVDFNTLAREAMEMNPNAAQIPADRLDTSIRFMAATMKVSAFASPVLSLLSLLLVAGVLLVSFRLFAGEGTFLQAFSVTLYAWMPRLIKAVIAVIVIVSRNTISIFDLQNPVMSNLGFLADPKQNPIAYALASSADLFAVWSVILLIIGFSIMSRLSRARSAAIVIGWWIVINLLSLIGPAMQMMRR